ncbi:unnamed protein product [Rhizophagus irregularis]|nr:unnamed protein product [Rhizophagus irregularis]
MSTLILTFKSASVTSEVRENFRLVKASDNPAFRQDKKLEWQKFEKFNAKFLALRLSHFKVAGYDKIKLKDLLKGVNISEDLLDIEVVIPEKVKLHSKLKNENTSKLKSKESLPDEDTAMTARRMGFNKNLFFIEHEICNQIMLNMHLNAAGAYSDAFPTNPKLSS